MLGADADGPSYTALGPVQPFGAGGRHPAGHPFVVPPESTSLAVSAAVPASVGLDALSAPPPPLSGDPAISFVVLFTHAT